MFWAKNGFIIRRLARVLPPVLVANRETAKTAQNGCNGLSEAYSLLGLFRGIILQKGVNNLSTTNVLPLIAQAIAIKKDFRAEVDALFAEHRERLQEVPLNHPIFNNRFFREQDLETEIAARKVAALYRISNDPDYDRAEEVGEALDDICKRAYRNIWRYVASNHSMKTADIQRVTGGEVTAFGVLCYLGQMNRNIFPVADEDFMVAYAQFSLMLRKAGEEPLAIDDCDEIVGTMVNDVMAVLDDEFSEEYPPTFAEWKEEPEYGRNNRLAALEQLLANERMYVDVLHSVRFPRSEIKEAVKMYILYSGVLNRTIEDVEDLVDEFLKWYVSILPALGYAKLYHKAREIAISYVDQFAANAEQQSKDERVKQLTGWLEDARRLKEQKQEQLNDLQLEYDRLKINMVEMQSKLADAEQEIGLLTDIAQQNSELPSTLPDKDISHLKILVAGGHPTWQQRIAEAFPNVTIVEGENFDPALVDSCDVVAFNWLYAGHKMYYKLINRARTRNKPIVYISNTNLQRFAQLVGNSE